MTEYKDKVENIKINLYRLHFLLTETESEENQREGIDQFKLCFNEVVSFLAEFLKEEFSISAKSVLEILAASFEKRLFTKDMTNSLNEMAADFKALKSKKNVTEIYPRIKSIHGHHLQVIYDMLIKMGEDVDNE